LEDFMRYQHLSIAIALAMLQLATARAAGPFDGRWTGSWTGVSNIGTSTYPCKSYIGNVDVTVADGHVTGVTTGQYQGTIEGTVAANGKFTGKIGPYAMSGSFSAKQFRARFTTDKCAMSMSAKPAR
jgi:hypothetical protein